MTEPEITQTPLPWERVEDHEDAPEIPTTPMVPSMGAQEIDVGSLFRLALANGAGSVDALDKLLELHDRVQRRHAELEFARAFVAFQEQVPPIPRNTHVEFATKDGRKVSFDSANFETIMEFTKEARKQNGFSVGFDMKVDGALVVATCYLRHRDGHSTSNTASVPWASTNPGMSDQQKYAAALTFCKRIALTAVLGLSLTDPEGEDQDQTTITEKQAATLEALIEEVGQDKAAFLKWQGVERIADVLARRYERAVHALEAKRKQ